MEFRQLRHRGRVARVRGVERVSEKFRYETYTLTNDYERTYVGARARVQVELQREVAEEVFREPAYFA
jgi:hypothetical protein